MQIPVDVMRSPRVKAKLFEKAATIASRKADDGRVLETISIAAGNYAVDDGDSTYDVGRAAFETRFLKIGRHFVEMGRSFVATYAEGSIDVGRGPVPCSAIDDLVWCDRNGGPVAFVDDPLDAVLRLAIARGPVANAIVEVLADLRARLSASEYTMEMREFDRLYAEEPKPVDASREARISEVEKALASQITAFGFRL